MNKFDLKEYMNHFPEVTPEMADFCSNHALLHSRYLFTRNIPKFRDQWGYCTHCNKSTFINAEKTGPLKHKSFWRCPHCFSSVEVRHEHYKRSRMVDDAYFVYYEKSRIDPSAVVAMGLYVVRDYRGDIKKVETKFKAVALYLFSPKNNQMIFRSTYSDSWRVSSSIFSLAKGSMFYKDCAVSLESVSAAIHGTPLQYAPWHRYTHQSPDLVTFFELASKYPSIEYLTKMNLEHLVKDKLLGRQTYNAIHWRGKNLQKVLRLSKAEINALVASKIEADFLLLKCYHFFKKNGIHLTFAETESMKELVSGTSEMEKLLRETSLDKLVKYILKQLRREGAAKRYSNGKQVMLTISDYWKECRTLGYDLNREHVRYPNNLDKAHTASTEKINPKKNAGLNRKIQERLDKLKEMFDFESNVFFIRPVRDSSELIREGRLLRHCVAGYATRYATGETNILVLRKCEEPNVPFFTVEVKGFAIQQIYGEGHCQPTPEIKAFMNEFINARLKVASKKYRKTTAQVVG